MGSTIGALQLADWRRRVTGLYAGVRQLSARNPADGHELWRSGRDELFAGHPLSPLLPDDRARFTGLTVSRYDPDWRFELEVRRKPDDEDPERFDGNADDPAAFVRIGRVRVPYLGDLALWRFTGYGGGLFLPIRDSLAGVPGGTFEGGRYLLDTAKGADLGAGADDDSIVVDFNFAYNPPFAYDPSWRAPSVGRTNTVHQEIGVGERWSGAPRG
ncbi:DUF1684 domain-containing protein [Agromyces seonyuensis]|uniref:DUF1684 domain-containing protein n=1 Tax=Agromyces seonyuensis TaxID=2662446 RepID=A0A6I4P193_9MICO|nr:DUF1684 domain-containing protein [Agromyces seonyuensis]MWC00309.1 DUF1684 domain-containing protein [Agromyces seonyuensis]